MPFQNYPNQRMDLTDNRAERFNLHYRGEFEGLTLDARSWHEDVEHAMDFGADKRFWYGMASNVPGSMSEGRPCSPISYTCAAGMPMLSDSINSGGKLAAEFALGGKDLLRIGGELHAYRLQDYWPASGGGMWPGAFVNVSMTARTLPGAVVVPQAAIIQSARGPIVYTVKDEQAQPRPVQVLYAQGDDAAVSGVRPGERIVLDGRQNLRPGSRIVERPREGGGGGGGGKGGGSGNRGERAASDAGAGGPPANAKAPSP